MEFPTRYGHASPSKKAMASFHMTPDAYSSPKRVQRTPSQALSDMGVNDTSGSMRTSVFGSCVQVLATVITALFHHVNNNHYYAETTADNNTTRKAKLLYVGLLEKVQKERGEWQGFCGEKQPKNNGGKSCDSAMDILTASLNDFGKEDCIGVLNELLDVSFKNLRGALVLPELYAKHRKKFEAISMETPPSLNALLLIRGLLTDMEREEKLCLFRLLSLWYLLPVVNETLDLRKLIEDKHTLVFSESSEMEFMTGRKSNRHDHVAMDMLLILVQHREVLFSDLEFLLIKQELQVSHGNADSPEVEEEDPAHKLDDDSYHGIPVAVAVDDVELARQHSVHVVSAPPSATNQAAVDQESNEDNHSNSSSPSKRGPTEPGVLLRADRINRSPKRPNPRQSSYLDLSESDAIQMPPSIPTIPEERRATHCAVSSKHSIVRLGSPQKSGIVVPHPRLTRRESSRSRSHSTPSISPRKRQQHNGVQRATYKEEQDNWTSDVVSKYLNVPVAAATLCTMATVMFFAFRNKS